MANLLFLTQRIPYPPTKGEKIRVLRILDYLRRFHDVHLGTLIDDPHDRAHADTVRAMCKDAYFANLNRKWAKLLCLRGLLYGEPLSVTFFRNRGLRAWVRRALRQVRPEIIVVCSSNMANYVLNQGYRGRICLVDLIDVDSEKWRAYAEVARFPMRWVYTREWRLTAELETRIARECDWSTFVSEDEAQVFARLAPECAAKIRAISNGVDLAYFDPDQSFAPVYDVSRPNFVFTGTMDYPPNADAVVWFATAILPIIRRSLPDARFHIVGSSPTAVVQKLAELPGVDVTGRVADVRPHTAHATACVAPMRIARGIQNKVLEAMAMARPVVVTPEALEGIEARPGAELLLADDAEAFAAACCLANGTGAAAIGAAARARVLADYGWDQRLRGFDALLDLGSPGADPAAACREPAGTA